MELKAQKRSELGSIKAEKLRESGMIPAELYGHNIENIHLAVDAKELKTVYNKAGESEIVNLVVDGETKPTIIHDIQIHPISEEFRSVDFYQVNMKEEIELAVPFNFIGTAPAVKNFGGVLVKAMEELEIVCLPGNIPGEIDIDLSTLTELGSSIYVKDLPESDKYRILTDPSTVIATVSEPREEEEEPGISVEDVKVEGEEKKAAKTESEE